MVWRTFNPDSWKLLHLVALISFIGMSVWAVLFSSMLYVIVMWAPPAWILPLGGVAFGLSSVGHGAVILHLIRECLRWHGYFWGSPQQQPLPPPPHLGACA